MQNTKGIASNKDPWWSTACSSSSPKAFRLGSCFQLQKLFSLRRFEMAMSAPTKQQTLLVPYQPLNVKHISQRSLTHSCRYLSTLISLHRMKMKQRNPLGQKMRCKCKASVKQAVCGWLSVFWYSSVFFKICSENMASFKTWNKGGGYSIL